MLLVRDCPRTLSTAGLLRDSTKPLGFGWTGLVREAAKSWAWACVGVCVSERTWGVQGVWSLLCVCSLLCVVAAVVVAVVLVVVLDLALVLGTLPLTLPLTALDATLHCSGTRPQLARQPARAQHSTSTGAAQVTAAKKRRAKSWQYLTSLLPFIIAPSPSIRAHSRPKPLCKAWPADAFFFASPIN